MDAATQAKICLERFGHYYALTTFYLGKKQLLLRRISALCLVLMGVHAGADLVDDAVFYLVDSLDAGIDALVFVLFDWLGSWSQFSEESMKAMALGWAEWIGPEEKESLSLVLALVTELLVDLMVFDFAWGVRPAKQQEMLGHRKRLALAWQEMRSALRPFDLERFCVVPAIFVLSLSGAAVAGQGIERFSTDFWIWLSPTWTAIRLAAALGLFFAGLLLWRMLPGLLLGAVRRQTIRVKHSAHQSLQPRLTGFQKLRLYLNRLRRTAVVTIVVSILAIAGLVGESGLGPMMIRLWGRW